MQHTTNPTADEQAKGGVAVEAGRLPRMAGIILLAVSAVAVVVLFIVARDRLTEAAGALVLAAVGAGLGLLQWGDGRASTAQLDRIEAELKRVAQNS